MATTKKTDEVIPTFAGFSPESLDFFKRLRKNNRREWFAKHRSEYEENLVAPMKALVFAVEEECHRAGISLMANRRSPVNRIYRDIRFSPDKSPYFTFIGAQLTRDGTNKSPGVVYLHFSDNEAFIASGFWQPERELMQAWRARIIEKSDDFLAMVKELKRGGLSLASSYRLRGMPRGYSQFADSPLAEHLKLTSFVVSRPVTAKECTSRTLPKTVGKFAAAASPLLRFGWAIADGQSKRRSQQESLAEF